MVYGQYVDARHEGYCEMMRWRTANALDQPGIAAAMSALCVEGLQAIERARERVKETLVAAGPGGALHLPDLSLIHI